MSAPTTTADVTVVGAGIIGLLNALSLAKRGLRVTLVDDVVHQRVSYKVGESFLVSTAFARTIGELDRFLDEESFIKLGVWFTYGMEGRESFDGVPAEWAIAPLSEYTVRQVSDSHEDHYLYQLAENRKWFRALTVDMQICRPDAEAVLQKVAREHPGITFLDTARVQQVTIGDTEPHTLSWADTTAGTNGTIRSAWVVDCSGRNRMLARQLGHTAEEHELDDGFKTTALWAQFDGIDDAQFEPVWRYHDQAGESTRRDLYTLHLWGEGYWIWVIRLSSGRISVGVTYDQRMPPEGRTPRDKFWSVIGRYPVLTGVITPEHVLEFRTYRNVQHLTDTFVDRRRYAMVGDASSIIDAYYSQGMGQSCQTSWHVSNIISKDVHDNVLDERYIDRVNTSTYQDWLMIRNMVMTKYGGSVADPRFFLLSHILDLLVIWSNGTARSRWSAWLCATEGDPRREDSRSRRDRLYCERHLFYSNAGIWSWLPQHWVRRVQGHAQRTLADRAMKRLDAGLAVAGTFCQISLTRPAPKLWKLLRPSHGVRTDVSSSDYVAPPEVRRTALPATSRIVSDPWQRFRWVLRLREPVLLANFLAAYVYDGIDTSIRLRRAGAESKNAIGVSGNAD